MAHAFSTLAESASSSHDPNWRSGRRGQRDRGDAMTARGGSARLARLRGPGAPLPPSRQRGLAGISALARLRGNLVVVMIGRVRHNPSTVVVLAGRPGEQVLAAVNRSLNVVLVRPEPTPSAGADGGGGIEAATGALRRAAGISAAYVLVAADPLGAVAAAWQAMWQVSAEPQRADEFELRAAEAMGAWRAKRFELPDYYLVLAGDGAPGGAAAGGAPGLPGLPGLPGRPTLPGRARGSRTSTWVRCAPCGRTGWRWRPAPHPPRRRTPC